MITKAEITETAFYLFAETGFHETSMEDIADALGLKKQSLYSHFRSKNELILAVLREQQGKIKDELDRLISQHCHLTIEFFLKFLFIRISIVLSHRERLLLWKRLPLYTHDDDLKGFLAQTFHDFHESITHSLAEVLAESCVYFRDPQNLSTFMILFMVLLQGYADVMLTQGYSNETAELIWGVFWNGVRSSIESDIMPDQPPPTQNGSI